ncbi:hypothetical protein [Paraburkholderia sp. BL27I4N3]|uniref:hypothetical protein n=1 Tax=unclassified Paraburkholderia TaxID=2615204 RepID=UPI000E39CFA7|nr:hypothetical protein [Paraburkholderia sp. BL27I4N3]REE22017.1 hypothetical protein B0G71_5213 [Paraburkholderia sp. BL27I4N3]RKR36085.1 hypothetical protein B0G82_4106 [Paraburkholderia sp. BL17N1]
MPLVHPKYKVAVVQAAPVWLNLEVSIDKTIELVNEAAANVKRYPASRGDLKWWPRLGTVPQSSGSLGFGPA